MKKNPLLVSMLLIALVACQNKEKSNESSTISAPTEQQIADRLAKEEAAVPEIKMKEAYFGETHLHTGLSLDALIGGCYLMPAEAYQFAKGDTMTVNGIRHSIGRPLDFAAVTDHAEYIGESYSATHPNAKGYDQEMLKELRGLKTIEEKEEWFTKYVVSNNRSGKPSHPEFYAGVETLQGAWKLILDANQKEYVPGKFTTIPGFEWSSVIKGGNMHRNIFFRDMNVCDVPLSAIDDARENELWKWMVAQEAKGSKLFAVPHNSNASKGIMFGGVDANAQPYDADYAQLRNRMEPLVEMMQVKGNSEVVQSFWQNDEFAGFENALSIANYSGRTFIKQNFVRWALIEGLNYQNKLGTNPFQLGFVGGTDSHNGTPGDVREDNFIGSHGPADGSVDVRRDKDVAGWIMGKDLNPGALTGVWATKNTRAAIWDGMHSRETFATSGTRIKVRFFGGENLSKPQDVNSLVKEGYEKGVPMGGTLTHLSKSPTFTVYAQKDPEGANLDRIQIIKGWVNSKGEHQEKIIEVVWSGDRKLNSKGKLPEVGNTVDAKTATYTNSIGATTLFGTWTDKEFDSKQNALYYVRVLEIPTPRWSTYDAVRNNLALLKDVPAIVQERAWASPIWYNPK